MYFLGSAYHSGKDRDGRPGTREKEIGFERYPSFQKRDAHALRFGSMNPISRGLGPWEHGEDGIRTRISSSGATGFRLLGPP